MGIHVGRCCVARFFCGCVCDCCPRDSSAKVTACGGPFDESDSWIEGGFDILGETMAHQMFFLQFAYRLGSECPATRSSCVFPAESSTNNGIKCHFRASASLSVVFFVYPMSSQFLTGVEHLAVSRWPAFVLVKNEMGDLVGCDALVAGRRPIKGGKAILMPVYGCNSETRLEPVSS